MFSITKLSLFLVVVSTSGLSENTAKSSAAPIEGEISPEGVCGVVNGTNFVCRDEAACCSRFGFCGSGLAFCGAGCNPEFGECGDPSKGIGPAGECGPSEDGKVTFVCLGEGPCCSKEGFCGVTDEFCGVGCNKTFGKCGKGAKQGKREDGKGKGGKGKAKGEEQCNGKGKGEKAAKRLPRRQ